MKKAPGLIIAAILVCTMALGGWFYMISTPSSEMPDVLSVQKQRVERVFSQQENIDIDATPSTFRIPSLGVEAAVESVGLDSQNNMDVPKNDYNVAWYNLGYKPGENGSAVIAGHYDTRAGTPAVFYELGNLAVGETIEVEYPNKETHTFRVTDKQVYNHDQVPMQKVFNTKGTAGLNLITCQGVFDPNSQIYSKRMVVYTEKVN